MSFQWIFDGAETMSLDTKKVVGTTITRDGTVRSTSRGGQVWRFTVKLPDGPAWSEYRQNIALAEALDRTTVSTVQINDAGYNSWFTAYQGNSVNSTGFEGTWTQGGTTLTLTTSPTTSSGFKFKAGDFIQLGAAGKVYKVAANVAFNSNTVTLHRPIIDATQASATALPVGINVTWSVICTDFPQWTIFSRDQISWSGAFVFYESLT
jgi:hypothetical protein